MNHDHFRNKSKKCDRFVRYNCDIVITGFELKLYFNCFDFSPEYGLRTGSGNEQLQRDDDRQSCRKCLQLSNRQVQWRHLPIARPQIHSYHQSDISQNVYEIVFSQFNLISA